MLDTIGRTQPQLQISCNASEPTSTSDTADAPRGIVNRAAHPPACLRLNASTRIPHTGPSRTSQRIRYHFVWLRPRISRSCKTST